MKIMLDKGAYMPERAHDTDAGLDIKSPFGFVLPKGGARVIDTGVHIQLPVGTVGMLKSKSGLNIKHGVLNEGVIDVGYTGSIRVKLYNNGGGDVIFNKGDKISQLVIVPALTPDLEIVDSLEDTERGANGFGSTGR